MCDVLAGPRYVNSYGGHVLRVRSSLLMGSRGSFFVLVYTQCY